MYSNQPYQRVTEDSVWNGAAIGATMGVGMRFGAGRAIRSASKKSGYIGSRLSKEQRAGAKAVSIANIRGGGKFRAISYGLNAAAGGVLGAVGDAIND
jgi:hypothetical protein